MGRRLRHRALFKRGTVSSNTPRRFLDYLAAEHPEVQARMAARAAVRGAGHLRSVPGAGRTGRLHLPGTPTRGGSPVAIGFCGLAIQRPARKESPSRFRGEMGARIEQLPLGPLLLAGETNYSCGRVTNYQPLRAGSLRTDSWKCYVVETNYLPSSWSWHCRVPLASISPPMGCSPYRVTYRLGRALIRSPTRNRATTPVVDSSR